MNAAITETGPVVGDRNSYNQFMEIARNRITTRQFEPDYAVPKEHYEMILEAARHAPSGANAQPWHYIVIRDPEVKQVIAGETPASTPPPRSAAKSAEAKPEPKVNLPLTADEKTRLLMGSPSHIAEINHYLFGGRRDFSKPFAIYSPFGLGILDLAVADLAHRLAQVQHVGTPIEGFLSKSWLER